MASPFLNYISEKMRLKRYAKRTIQSYVYWIKAYINFNGQRHPLSCHDKEVEQFLSYLTNKLDVAPNTQGIALNALVFLYRGILLKPLTLELNFNKSKQHTKLPVVLTQAEVTALLTKIVSRYALPCQLMYCSGLRLMEVVRYQICFSSRGARRVTLTFKNKKSALKSADYYFYFSFYFSFYFYI